MATIRVYSRIKPTRSPQSRRKKDYSASLGHDDSDWLTQQTDQELSIEPATGTSNSRTPSRSSHASTPGKQQSKKRTFRFDRVLSESSSQEEVFNTVASDVVDGVVDGYNGTIFAYGVTGSGKTYTVEGSCRRYAERGLIARCLSHIYAKLASKRCESSVFINYLEIYQDVGYDLLNPGARGKSMMATLPKVIITQQGDNVVIRNLSSHLAANEEVALNLHFQGQANRRIAETPLNQRSSRSHAIFTIALVCQEPDSEVVTRSKLHLVDLAGSERVSKSGVQGQQLSEAKHINLSLHHLEHVIVMLHKQSKDLEDVGSSSRGSTRKRKTPSSQGIASRDSVRSQRASAGYRPRTRQDFGHIPYRNSLLTMVLKDSLGGNCLTAMIATLAQTADGHNEAMSTCAFAQRVACITNSIMRNEELDDKAVIRKLKLRVAELEAEVERYRAKLAIESSNPGLPAVSGREVAQDTPLGADDKELCMRVMKQFLMGQISDPVAAGMDSVSKFRQCMVFLQLLIHSRANPQPQLSAVAAAAPRQTTQSQSVSTPQQQHAPLSAVATQYDQSSNVGASGDTLTVQETTGTTPITPFACVSMVHSPQVGEHDNPQAVSTKLPRKLRRKAKAPSGNTEYIAVEVHANGLPLSEAHQQLLSQQLPQHGHHAAVESGGSWTKQLSPNAQSPNQQRSPTYHSQPASPTTSPATSPRQQRSPHISPSSKANLSKNQKPVFASVFEQKRAEEIERRSQRLLAVQNVQEQRQQHLILSQLILLEKEQKLHVESLSEALAAQHARVKALKHQNASHSDVRQEKLAERSLRKRQVDGHAKLRLVQQQLNAYREAVAIDQKHRVSTDTAAAVVQDHGAVGGQDQVQQYVQQQQQRPHHLHANAAADSPAHMHSGQSSTGPVCSRAHASTSPAGYVASDSMSTVQSTTANQQPTALSPRASKHVATRENGSDRFHQLHQQQQQQLEAEKNESGSSKVSALGTAGITITPKTDARRVMRALQQEEERQRQLNQQMQQYQQSQYELELAAKERATRLKLQQFRAMLQGQKAIQESSSPHHPQSHSHSTTRTGPHPSSTHSSAATAVETAQRDSHRPDVRDHTQQARSSEHVTSTASSDAAAAAKPLLDFQKRKHAAWQKSDANHDFGTGSSNHAAAAHGQGQALETTQQHAMKDRFQQLDDSGSANEHRSSSVSAPLQKKTASTALKAAHVVSPAPPTGAASTQPPGIPPSQPASQLSSRSSQFSSAADVSQPRYQTSVHKTWPINSGAPRSGDSVSPTLTSSLPESEQHQSGRDTSAAGKPPASSLSAHRQPSSLSQQVDNTHVSAGGSGHSSHIHATSSTSSRSTQAAGHLAKTAPGKPAQSPHQAHAPATASNESVPTSSVSRATPRRSQSTTNDPERQFLSAAQRQRERVERIRRAQQAASVIQRAWRRRRRRL